MNRPSNSARFARSRMTRRRFLARSANTAAIAGLASITIVPRRVLGGPRHVAPSEKLNLAFVGVGGQGMSNLKHLSEENVVALCDVDQKRAAEAYKLFPDAKRYTDFREMLATENDIDGVVVSTPDHTHAVAAMAAIRRGKHVYCEKPLTHTVAEARALAAAAREAKVATQMGNSGQAEEGIRLLCEWIWDGAIGPVREVHVWSDRPMRGLHGVLWPQGIDRPTDTPPVPPSLSWDLWLGPAPARPYHPAYLPVKWRGWCDFGTGALGDMGCHHIAAAFRPLKLGYPTSVQSSSTSVNKETYPLASLIRFEFPARGNMPPVSLTWYDGGIRPPRPPELEDGEQLGFGDNGLLFIGDEGKITAGNSGREPRLIPKSRMAAYKPPKPTLPRSPGHWAEWVAACKGGPPAGSNFDVAAPLTETVLLGTLSLRPELREAMLQQELRWDGPNMRFTNVPEANKFLRTDYREGWTL